MSFSIGGRPGGVMLPGQRSARRIRRPNHNAYVHFAPWVLQPFFFAPVLPGETLKNLLMQARVLTTPLANNQVIGWWLETYVFYVKHRHMIGSTTYQQMMLDLNASTAAAEAGSSSLFFNHQTADMMFASHAYYAVVNEFFRGDGEDNNTAAGIFSGTRNYVRLKMPGWWDSILPDTTLTTGLGGIADDSIGGANTALDQLGEVGKALETWQTLRMLGITNMEYDDYLRSFGVSIAAPVDDRPELLRYTREWQYPSSAVSVTDTAQRVSSVVSWSVTERADKNRFFKEPGIVMGCVVARPKLYHNRQQAGVGMLKSAQAWQTPFSGAGGYERYASVNGLAGGYSFDTGDLFNQGDQYWFIERGTAPPMLTFPADGELDYPDTALVNSLFTDAATGHVKMDATVSLQIATGAVGPDITPTTV